MHEALRQLTLLLVHDMLVLNGDQQALGLTIEDRCGRADEWGRAAEATRCVGVTRDRYGTAQPEMGKHNDMLQPIADRIRMTRGGTDAAM